MMGNEYIRHYASPYYDPVKAHEYYMKTRELKGRRSVQKLSDEGKKVWAYTKNEIKTEKKEKVDAEREKQKQTTTNLRERASETRKQISSRLKELNEALTKRAASRKERIESEKKSDLEDVEKNAAKRREQIESKTNAEIEKLMAVEIPKGLPKAERAERLAERNEKIAKLRSSLKADKSKLSEDSQSDKASVRTDAQSRKQKVSDETREDKAANSANASAERAQVSAELKSAITAAREAYKAAKESLDSSYEEIYQRENSKWRRNMISVAGPQGMICSAPMDELSGRMLLSSRMEKQSVWFGTISIIHRITCSAMHFWRTGKRVCMPIAHSTIRNRDRRLRNWFSMVMFRPCLFVQTSSSRWDMMLFMVLFVNSALFLPGRTRELISILL